MKKIWFLALSLFMTVGLFAAPPGSNVSIRGTLILASNNGQGIDPALRPYERQLKRMNFSSYKTIGRGATQIRVPGTGVIKLGQDFEVQINATPAAGNRVPVEIRWTQGRKTLIHTSAPLPLVTGGPSYNGGTLILVLDGR